MTAPEIARGGMVAPLDVPIAPPAGSSHTRLRRFSNSDKQVPCWPGGWVWSAPRIGSADRVCPHRDLKPRLKNNQTIKEARPDGVRGSQRFAPGRVLI